MNPTIYLNSAGQKEKSENLTISQYSNGNELNVYTVGRYDVVFAIFKQPNGAKSKQIHLAYDGYDDNLGKHLYKVEIPYSATCFAIATNAAKLGLSVHLWTYGDGLIDKELVAVADIVVTKSEDTEQHDPAYYGEDLDNLWVQVSKNAQDNFDNKQELNKIKTGETAVERAKKDENGEVIASKEYVAENYYNKEEADETYATQNELNIRGNSLQDQIDDVNGLIEQSKEEMSTGIGQAVAAAQAYADQKDNVVRSDIASVLATKADSTTIATELNKIKQELGGKAVSYSFMNPESVGLDSESLSNQVEISDRYTDLNGLKLSDAKIGDDIRFVSLDVRDYWVYRRVGNTLFLSILETEKVDLSEIERAEDERKAHEVDRVNSETQRKADEIDRVARYNAMGVLKMEIEQKNITLTPIYNLFHDAGYISESQFNQLSESEKADKIFFVKLGE